MFEKIKEYFNQPSYEEQLSSNWNLAIAELNKEIKQKQEKFNKKISDIDNMSEIELLRLIAKELCRMNFDNQMR